MRTTEARMEMLLQKLRIRRASRRLSGQFKGLATVCILLICCLFSLFKMISFDRIGESQVTGLYGSVLLNEGAGAYVLVGVLAFVAGAVMTILCFWLKREQKIHKEGL